MGSELRHQKLSLEEELKSSAHKFSFEMASYILEYNSELSFGKEISVWQAPFKTISINSFHIRGTEIEKIEKIGETDTIFIERLAISGLNAPLPTPYAELMHRRSNEKDLAMRSFINIFNSRLLGISYQISKRRYLCLQKHSNRNCMLVKSIAAFIGESPETMNRHISRLSYLFWTKEKSADGLEAIITSVFQFSTKIKQFHPTWLKVCENNLLGKNLKLGKNSGIGKTASVSSFSIEIELTHKNFENIRLMLLNKEYLYKITFLIKKYLGAFISCYIKIIPQNVPSPYLKTFRKKEANSSLFLGKTSWLQANNNFDAATIKI